MIRRTFDRVAKNIEDGSLVYQGLLRSDNEYQDSTLLQNITDGASIFYTVFWRIAGSGFIGGSNCEYLLTDFNSTRFLDLSIPTTRLYTLLNTAGALTYTGLQVYLDNYPDFNSFSIMDFRGFRMLVGRLAAGGEMNANVAAEPDYIRTHYFEIIDGDWTVALPHGGTPTQDEFDYLLSDQFVEEITAPNLNISTNVDSISLSIDKFLKASSGSYTGFRFAAEYDPDTIRITFGKNATNFRNPLTVTIRIYYYGPQITETGIDLENLFFGGL